jgi:hypothetical protein
LTFPSIARSQGPIDIQQRRQERGALSNRWPRLASPSIARSQGHPGTIWKLDSTPRARSRGRDHEQRGCIAPTPTNHMDNVTRFQSLRF